MSKLVLNPIGFTISEDMCDTELRQSLQITVQEVLGEGHRVEAGKKYLVSGAYIANGTRVARICLGNIGRCIGKPASIDSGPGQFEVTAEPIEVEKGRESVLDLIMFDDGGTELGVRLRVELQQQESAAS